jgi:hypothetical protein
MSTNAIRRHATPLSWRALASLAVIYLGIGLILRILLWNAFGRVEHIDGAALAWILSAGICADAVETLYLLAPMALLLWGTPERWLSKPGGRALIGIVAFLWLFGVLFLGIIEYFFFEEFDSRLNLVAVDYLMYPTEVVGDIWASYPVISVLLITMIVAAGLVWATRRSVLPASQDGPSPSPASRTWRYRSIAAVVLVLAICVAATQFETHTLANSANRVANEIAANGASSFFRALRTNEIDYHAYYASRRPSANLRDLSTQLARGGGTFTQLDRGCLDRSFPGKPDALGRLNVVVIASESFGAEFIRLNGSAPDWTPSFDEIAP